jgi:hypothetical protein
MNKMSGVIKLRSVESVEADGDDEADSARRRKAAEILLILNVGLTESLAILDLVRTFLTCSPEVL